MAYIFYRPRHISIHFQVDAIKVRPPKEIENPNTGNYNTKDFMTGKLWTLGG